MNKVTVIQDAWHQCPITNASQRAHSGQPHTDVEILKFLVLPILDEIMSNIFVYVNILAITIQQVCSNKTLLVWSIWSNLSPTLHKTPCYGPGSQLWRANGTSLHLALTTKFPTWCVEGVRVGTAYWRKSVACDRGGLPQGVNQWNKGNIIWIMVLLCNKIVSHTISATRDTWDVWMCPRAFDNRYIKHWILFSRTWKKLSRGNCYTTDSQTHIYMKIQMWKTI